MNSVSGRLMLSVAAIIVGLIIVAMAHDYVGERYGLIFLGPGLIVLIFTLTQLAFQYCREKTKKYVPQMVEKYGSLREQKLAETERKSAEDELLKAKMLFDAGILTQEEFDKKIQKLKQKVL